MRKLMQISNNELLDVRICERGRRTGEIMCYILKGKYKGNNFAVTRIEKGRQPIQFENYEALITALNEKRPGWREFDGEADYSFNTAWYKFKKLTKGMKKAVGCWNVYFTNTLTDEQFSTQGDVKKGTAWEDFFTWLVEDIEEMDVGNLSNIRFDELSYEGIDDAEYFAN